MSWRLDESSSHPKESLIQRLRTVRFAAVIAAAGVVAAACGSGGSGYGHPRCWFAGDAKPGDTNGEGLSAFGARWYVVGADGSEIADT
jgi:hypothetical protein